MLKIAESIAGADGLRDDDALLVRKLVQTWADHYERNILRHVYYTMHNRLHDLGISVPPTLRNLNAACGWAKKAVDVMVDHSKFDGFTVDDAATQAELDAIVRRNRLKTKYRKATTSALEQSFNLYFVSRDEGGHARVTPYPASVCGCLWDDANDRLQAAMFVVSMTKNRYSHQVEPDWVDIATEDNLIRIKLGERNKWKAEYEPHGLGHIPVFVAAHESTLERPFGCSRITREVMGYIDCAVREGVNAEIASAFAASAQKYLLGTDGDPFTETSRWAAYIGNIFNIDATADGIVPQFGQLDQPSMEPLNSHFRELCGKMSAATGIHIAQFGYVHDQPSSADAIYAENEPLILKVRNWNDDAGDTLTDVAIACLATERGVRFADVDERDYNILARFQNPAMPTLAQMTDANVKIASVVPDYAQTPTFWRANGFTDEQVVTVLNEIRRNTASFTLANLLNSNGGGDASA